MSENRITRNNALLLFLIAAAGLLFTAFSDTLLLPLLQGFDVQIQILIVNLTYYLPFIALPCAITLRRHPSAMRTDSPSGLSLFLISLCAIWCVFMVNNITVLWAIPLEKIGLDISAGGAAAPQTRQQLVTAILGFAALPAVCEELLLRGVMLSAFEQRGSRRAVWLTALFFMLLHGSPVGMPGEFLMGTLIALVTICFNSVYAGMVFHTVYNSTLLFLEYMQRNMPVPEGDLLTRIGGFSGVCMIFVELLIGCGFIFIMLRIFLGRKRARGVHTVRKRDPLFTRRELPLLIGCGLVAAAAYILSILSMLHIGGTL